ncbi:hypothetical protein ACTXT7_001163 [Hymenolepis weldensis]
MRVHAIADIITCGLEKSRIDPAITSGDFATYFYKLGVPIYFLYNHPPYGLCDVSESESKLIGSESFAMNGNNDNLMNLREEIDLSTLLNAAMCYAIHSKNHELLVEILDRGADPNFLNIGQPSKKRRDFTKALVHFYTYGTKATEELKYGSIVR